MIKESSSGSIRTLILSNEKLSVKILAGKGGDINQITYLPEQAELLHTEDENFARYDNRDLLTNPLSRYSEDSTGGWQDVVPGYGRYGSLVFQEFPVGTAATLPWDYQTQTAAGGDTRKEEEVNLSVQLPEFPLFMKKQIRLEDETLIVTETIRNEGGEPADLRGHSTRHSAEASWMNRLKSPIRVRKFFFPHYMPAREEKRKSTSKISAVCRCRTGRYGI